jgi:carbohydrate kinase (thermoresistant glucokinase family)
MAALILASPHNRRIVVMGVSGSGKTAVGKALARALGILFRDGADLHPARNVIKMHAGQTLTDDDRWGWLELVANSLRRDAPVVIACSALRAVYRSHIRVATGTAVQFIYLSGTRDLIAQRIANNPHNQIPQGLLDSQFERLEPPSATEAMIIPITLTVAQQVAMILEVLAKGATSSAPPAPTH